MLSDQQVDYLQTLLRNEMLLGIVSQIFADVIEKNKPEATPADSDTLLGQKYRGYELAATIILEGFKKLNSYKKPEKKEKIVNRAI